MRTWRNDDGSGRRRWFECFPRGWMRWCVAVEAERERESQTVNAITYASAVTAARLPPSGSLPSEDLTPSPRMSNMTSTACSDAVRGAGAPSPVGFQSVVYLLFLRLRASLQRMPGAVPRRRAPGEAPGTERPLTPEAEQPVPGSAWDRVPLPPGDISAGPQREQRTRAAADACSLFTILSGGGGLSWLSLSLKVFTGTLVYPGRLCIRYILYTDCARYFCVLVPGTSSVCTVI